MKTKFLRYTLPLAFTLALANCAQKASDSASSTTTDSSASGAAAEAIGGALSDSSSGGTQAMHRFAMPDGSLYASMKSSLNPMTPAHAADLCPTFHSTGSGCSASGGNIWLSYNSCTFTGNVDWSGVQELSMSSGSAACGTFPNPGANGTLYRQFVNASGANVASSVSLTSSSRTAVIDDASNNLANFDGATLTNINPNGGYGVAVSFNGAGKRSAVQIGHHVSVSGSYDHSVYGSLSIVENSGSTQRTISGSVAVYHNLMRVIGTSTFNNVVHSNVCCLPISGSVTTVFSAGAHVSPTLAGSRAVGKSETLTFTGCGTATLETYDGSTVNVSLNRCF